MRKNTEEIVGLIPAAGSATRLGRLPCSKEILPVAFRPDSKAENNRLIVACDSLLDIFEAAGIRTAYMVIRAEKWDIPAWSSEHPRPGMQLAFLVTGATPGVPHTLDKAREFIHDKTVALGFPDIIIKDNQCLNRLIRHRQATAADLALGLFPADQPQHSDLVDMDERGNVQNVVVKPARTPLRLTWGLAVWTPVFTDFLHRQLRARGTGDHEAAAEFHIGHAIQAAVADGMRVTAVEVAPEPYIDIGRPESYLEAIRRLGGMEH